MFAAVGTQGFVGLSATMDATQAPPSNQAQADVLHHSPIVETAKNTSLVLPRSFLQSKSAREKWFVRQDGFIPGGTDPHTYDCGQLFAWTVGQANTNAIGILRVVGRCLLSNPVTSTSANPQPNFNVSTFSVVNVPVGTSGVAVNFPFSSGVVLTNPLGITLQSSLFTLPAGNYLVDFAGDLDGSVVGSGLQLGAIISVNGTQLGPFLTATVPQSATSTFLGHVAISQTGFVQSNGTTTVAIIVNPQYSAGAPNFDGLVRFTAI
jgi:hypothetical protein